MQIGTKCFSATYIYTNILKKFSNPAGQKDARLEMKNRRRNWMKIADLNQLADGVKVKYMNKLETDHQKSFHEQYV